MQREETIVNRLQAFGSVAALALAGGTVTTTMAGQAAPAARPAPPPASFSHPHGNPYFPLRPGMVLHYRGSEGSAHFRERVATTHRTRRILGVRTRVVHDVLRRANGTLAEQTRDWYAADNHGNVWYFGEATATYDRHGHVNSREGSWQAGVHGARAGRIMPAHPGPTDAYRQEFLRGHAEDQAWIVQDTADVRVPYGRVHHALRSFEWTRLEPKVMSLKFYGRGLGIVTEHDVAGGNENFQLVSVTHH
jgi:hypothetical protein